MSYSAGNLELVLSSAVSDSTIKALDSVNTSLSSLSSTLKSITNTDLKWLTSFGTRITTLSKRLNEIDWGTQSSGLRSFTSAIAPLSGILNSFSATNLKSISSLGTRFGTLGKKLNEIDWGTVKSGFDSLTVAITPFIDKVSGAENSLKALNETLSKVSKKKLNNINDFAQNKGFGGFNFKRLFNIGLAIRFGRAVYRIVEYGSNFTETLNLWQVAMRDNLKQADKFIKKMNRAYGISQTTLMNAQATFKNMIGSLGNISDAVSYQLSESILQMALDFSSLYNVTFENAIQKFQAALAGQVRPVRSVSGYDITENTLQQIYESLGGTKSQRQLNRTEKQLLAIYAIFKQMEKSGAVGDLTKTLNSFANQSRMVSENFKELLTYTGLFFQNLLQSWGVLKYINAGLIFLTEIMKALTNYQAPNFLENMFETVTDTNKQVDELQGKLLDFDKIRALNSSSGADSFGIDETLINAFKNYKGVLDSVNNEARNLADHWLGILGFTRGTNGELDITEDKLNLIKSVVEAIAITVGVLLGAKIISSIKALITNFNLLGNSLTSVQILLVSGIIFAIVKAIEAFNNGDKVAGAFAITIGVVLVGALLALELSRYKAAKASKLAAQAAMEESLILTKQSYIAEQTAFRIKTISNSLMALAMSYGIASGIINMFEGDGRRVASICAIIVGGIMSVVAAIVAMNTAISWGTMLPVLLAGVGTAIAGVQGLTSNLTNNMPNANSIDSGVLSTSTSATKNIAAYSGGGATTSGTNASQLKGAVYQALVEYGKNHTENTPIVLNLDGEVAYKTVVKHAGMRGEFLSKR